MYRTTDDTALAAYLLLHDIKFLHGTIATSHPKRRAFVFHDNEQLDKLVEAFYNRTKQVAPLDYQEARATVSRYLKTDISHKIKIKTEVPHE